MSDPWFSIFEHAPEATFGTSACVFRQGDRVGSFHLVRSGGAKLVRTLADGTELVLHRAGPGMPIAEASLFSDRYHCDAICASETVCAVLPRARVLAALDETGLAVRALARAARDVQSLRTRIEVLRLRRLSDRLEAYLALHGPPSQGHWVDVADWIGVTPAALYRELAKRRP